MILNKNIDFGNKVLRSVIIPPHEVSYRQMNNKRKGNINFGERKHLPSRITAVYFSKNSFNIESILRWLMDRKLNFVNFNEDDNNYIFLMCIRDKFNQYELRQLEGENIRIEIGTK